MPVIEIHHGDLVVLKKCHPCGGFEWQVEKVGYEVEAKCLACGRQVSLARSEFVRRVKKVLPCTAEDT